MGCPAGKEVVDAGIPDSGPAVADAGPPPAPADLPPAELGASLELWFADGGLQEVPASKPTLIDPLQKLTLRLPRLKDFRVRVFDGADKVLVSDDRTSASDAGTAYEIGLAEPLKRGREYRVAV